MKKLIPIISIILFVATGSLSAYNFDKDKDKKSCCSSKKEQKNCAKDDKKSCCSEKKEGAACEKSSKKSKKCCTAKSDQTKTTEDSK